MDLYIKGCPFYVYFYSDDVHNVRKRLVNKLFILLFCLFIFHIYIYIYREGNGLRPTSLFK